MEQAKKVFCVPNDYSDETIITLFRSYYGGVKWRIEAKTPCLPPDPENFIAVLAVRER
jgi:hypothetical protein